jgi:hypothetical protein
MENYQFVFMAICFIAIDIGINTAFKKLKNGDADKEPSREYYWILLPGALLVCILFGLLVYNNWFMGAVMPDEFIENRKFYTYFTAIAAVLGIYRIAVGIYRHRKTKHDDTVFGDDDRSEARIVITSGLLLLLFALVAYYTAEVITPFIWRMKAV